EGGGLNYFNPRLGQFVKVIKNRLSGNNIKSLYLDHEILWIGTFQDGLNRFDTQSGRIDSYRFNIDDEHSLAHDNVYSITKLNGDLWIATYGGGICRSIDSGTSFQRFKSSAADPKSLSSNLCRVLYCDEGNDLWIGTDQGLNLMIDKNGRISFKTYLPKSKILCIMQDIEKRLWIGTANDGLFCLKKQMEEVSIEHMAGDLGQAVFGILQDSLRNLWLSTGSGLFRFNPQNNSIISFSDAAGLEKKEFNFNSFLKSRSGRFYFGSTNGLVSFNPSEVPTGEYVAPLVFSKISGPFQKYKSDGISPRSIQYTEHITFDYNDANFTLNFALLDYANPLDHLYEYKLEGIDQNWVQARGLASATYTIQKEGDYTFYCRAANYQGIWNPTVKQLEVTVLPPFYRSPIAYLLYSLLLISALIAVYYFIKLRKRLFLEKMTVQQQKTLHESRLQLYTDIAHEFKNPLTLIIGPLETLLSKYGTESLISKELIYARNNAKNLLHLINQLMSFRKSEADVLKMEVRLTDLVSFSKGICSRFEPEAESRSISLQFDCEKPEMHGYIDRDKMTKVLVNLLSNAFKFTPDDSCIFLELSEEDDHLQWRVMDSGPGIPPDLSSTIFNRYFTIPAGNEENSIRSGSGIGLALCRKMTELHHGRITCVPNDYGAEFLIRIPKGKDHFDPGDISSGHDLEKDNAFDSGPIVPKNNTLVSTSIEHKTRSETILVVEDNRELLTYLKDLFQDIYKVYTASNGMEGLALAQKKLPDLIISDILMDKMNGIHLCNQLKGKISTSHIPIILLTAKAAKASVLDGLSNGADDYVIKPFDPDELRMRVNNMLNHRKSLRQRMVKTFNLEPEKLELSNLDEEFVNKAIRLIESNIGNLNFTVEDFARHMMVSRQLLFTKMKSLTSMTPNNFIKVLRLKRAHQILQTSSMTISEVARKVGFRDPRYFTKCFQRQFKKLPSAVQKVE
ncbi:MAG: response regulator, partial [Saprospiraceae bacterium]|nr:response regulator [Saprospiraceae bacterium]